MQACTVLSEQLTQELYTEGHKRLLEEAVQGT